MEKIDHKNKQETFAELVADCPRKTDVVEVGEGNTKHFITIGELTGRERFELVEKEDDDRWDTMLWLCMVSMIQPPPPDDVQKLEDEMSMEWVIKVATTAMRLSGIEEDAADDAEKGSAGVSEIGG